MPQSLIKDNTGGHGQVEAANIIVGHGKRVTAILIEVKNICRESLGFFAENQEISRLVAGLTIRFFGLGGEKIELFFGLPLEKGVKIRPIDYVDKTPIVKTGSLQMLVGCGKSQGMNEVQDRVRGSAQSGNGAGVGGYFRLHKDNVKGFGIQEVSLEKSNGIFGSEDHSADIENLLGLGVFKHGHELGGGLVERGQFLTRQYGAWFEF